MITPPQSAFVRGHIRLGGATFKDSNDPRWFDD